MKKVKVILLVLYTFNKEHNVKKFHTIHKTQGTEPGFVVQEIITEDEFSGSMLKMLPAYNVFV